MVIRRLAIRNFGKVHDVSLELGPGINVLYGENESGKSTMHTFIRSMFYGIQRSRGRAAKNDSYTKYEPWENPSDFGGMMWIEENEKVYRLKRSFSKEHPAEELFCETDEELLDIEEGDLDQLLGGVSEVTYDNTVSVAQLKSVTGKDLVQELQNYMASYQGTGDTSVDLGRALQMLKMTRKGYITQEERLQRSRETEKEKLKANYKYMLQELQEFENKKNTLEQKHIEGRSSDRNDRRILEKQLNDLDNMKKVLGIAMFFTFLIPLLLTILFYVAIQNYIIPAILTLSIGAAGIGAELLYWKKMTGEQQKRRNSLRLLKKQEDKRGWHEERMAENLVEKQTALANLKEELREFDLQDQEISRAQMETDALNLAIDTMENLTGEFQSKIGMKLRMRTSEILCEITDGKYRRVLIDNDFRIQVNTEERIVPIESLSRGTLEQIYFALRMAAGELLCGDIQFPVILDDVFGMYDEERLSSVLHWLEKEPRQVIISTCHRREAEILKREQIAFHELSFDI